MLSAEWRTFPGSPWARTWHKIPSPRPCPAARHPLHPSPWFASRIVRYVAHKRHAALLHTNLNGALAETDTLPRKIQHGPNDRDVLLPAKFLSRDATVMCVMFVYSTERVRHTAINSLHYTPYRCTVKAIYMKLPSPALTSVSLIGRLFIGINQSHLSLIEWINWYLIANSVGRILMRTHAH